MRKKISLFDDGGLLSRTKQATEPVVKKRKSSSALMRHEAPGHVLRSSNVLDYALDSNLDSVLSSVHLGVVRSSPRRMTRASSMTVFGFEEVVATPIAKKKSLSRRSSTILVHPDFETSHAT